MFGPAWCRLLSRLVWKCLTVGKGAHSNPLSPRFLFSRHLAHWPAECVNSDPADLEAPHAGGILQLADLSQVQLSATKKMMIAPASV